MLARALARSISCELKRVQCTPDLLPVDITGYVDPRKETFVPGAVFANIVLADELNRAMPRTQSALLEAMGESQVTVDGRTHRLPDPFMVIATQNPIEHAGVNDLPEAQLDRFGLLLSPGYPDEEHEVEILRDRMVDDPLTRIAPCSASNGYASSSRWFPALSSTRGCCATSSAPCGAAVSRRSSRWARAHAPRCS